ncbi:hypothetical protein U1Q18_003054 [Sarracenia purpurea var. burkii]
MRIGGRQWLRPGDLSEYERKRIRRIKENNGKLNSLRLKNIAASVLDSVQPKDASKEGKRQRVDVDDDDYRQPNSEDYRDDESSDSFEHKKLQADMELLLWSMYLVLLSQSDTSLCLAVVLLGLCCQCS